MKRARFIEEESCIRPSQPNAPRLAITSSERVSNAEKVSILFSSILLLLLTHPATAYCFSYSGCSKNERLCSSGH